MNGIIILAAGASRRMGQPKQLLKMGEENLLSRVIRIARTSDFDCVSVVLGANIELIFPEIDTSGISVFLNPNWDLGMSSSLACGLKHSLRKFPQLASVLILLVDQPFLSVDLVNSFLETYQQKHPPVVAAHYAGTHGVPALFDKSIFPQLLEQEGQVGARKLIHQLQNELIGIDFPEGEIDLDTPEDLQQLK
jgi:molybdenum cofactor cytidylyltransferase